MKLATPTRIVAVVIGVPLVVWELFLAFGFTFSFRNNEPLASWLFVWFGFLLDVPALCSGIIWPRVGAAWLFVNAVVSLGIACGFVLTRGGFTALSAAIVVQAAVFWTPKFGYSALMWWVSKPKTIELLFGEG